MHKSGSTRSIFRNMFPVADKDTASHTMTGNYMEYSAYMADLFLLLSFSTGMDGRQISMKT